jgi:hypothetical protein
MCRVHLWAPRTDVELHQLETHPHLCPARIGGCPEQQILVRMLHESATWYNRRGLFDLVTAS